MDAEHNQNQNQNQNQAPISKHAIEEERKRLKATKHVIEKAWDTEVKCYENNLKQDSNCLAGDLNPYIFPYHKSCYLLLDMYMCLEGEFPYRLPIYVKKSARRIDHHGDDIREECYLPNSSYAVWSALVPKRRAPKYREILSVQVIECEELFDGFDNDWLIEQQNFVSSSYLFLNEWSEELFNRCKRWYSCDDRQDQVARDDDEDGNGDGDENDAYEILLKCKHFVDLPCMESLPKGLRTKILLKLLKHSLSELQRDHRLARAVLLAMIEYKCFDGEQGVDAFRYFLMTIASEFIHGCDEECLERENEDDDEDDDVGLNHICPDFTNFKLTLDKILRWGMTDFRKEHAVVLSAFVDDIFDSTGWEEQDEIHKLVGWDDEDFTHAKDTPLDLIRCILEGLNRLNYQFRCRAFQLLGSKYSAKETDDTLNGEINTAVASHLNCMKALVSIGESVLKRLKATPVTETLGSLLVTGLTLSFVEPSPKFAYLDHDNDVEGHYLGHYLCQAHCYGPTLIDATRYEVLITQASRLSELSLKRFKEHCGINQIHKIELDATASSLFLSPPSSQIVTVVKGLFLRQLVESHEAGCGYGDFLVWSGASVTPYDDLLYEHNMNFPNNAGYEETPLENSELGENMGLDQIEAMYDFSVLMLRRAWNYPWTPDSHASFQKPFRQAIKTIALCAHRHGMPIDISITVNSYLSRDWWPDERSECWLYECQIDKLQNALFHKEESVIKQYLIKCECKVAHACSGKHMKSINREGHRRLCKTPPMRVPTAEDLAMCCQIVEKSSGDDFLQEESNEEKIEICDLDNYDNGDEECEWESIASDEESYLETKASIPEIVLKYFENKAYRIQKREEHAFANHYNTE